MVIGTSGVVDDAAVASEAAAWVSVVDEVPLIASLPFVSNYAVKILPLGVAGVPVIGCGSFVALVFFGIFLGRVPERRKPVSYRSIPHMRALIC